MLSFFKAEIENYFLKYQQTVVINEMHSPQPPRKCCCIWLQCQKWLCPIPHTMKSIIILAIINVVICPSVNGLSSTRRRGGGGLDAVHTDMRTYSTATSQWSNPYVSLEFLFFIKCVSNWLLRMARGAIIVKISTNAFSALAIHSPDRWLFLFLDSWMMVMLLLLPNAIMLLPFIPFAF